MIVGVIGLGEIGSAIARLCRRRHTVYGRTRHMDELKGKTVEILHLCYPYTDSFVATAVRNIRELNPKLVINNSSVKPGTTEAIYNKTRIPAVHSPVMGKHPKIYNYLFEVDKIIGPIDGTSYRMAKRHFEELGLTTARFRSPLTSELAKLLDTTYYGWNIIFEKHVHRICRQLGADFHDVYTRLNRIYNRGYERTLPHVRRPILKHMPGMIGGHCVIPNATILHDWLGDELTAFLFKQNEKAAKETSEED